MNLVVDGVEFGEDDAVDGVRVVGGRVVGQSLVELDQLVYGLVAHQRLTDEQHQVWLVYFDQLWQLTQKNR